MDREFWTSVLNAIHCAARRVGWHGGRRRPVYPNWLIVAMYVWSVWHDRTLSWACDRRHYGALFRPRRLPSISQFTRRIKSDDCQRILQLVHDQFAQRGVVAGTSAGVAGEARRQRANRRDGDLFSRNHRPSSGQGCDVRRRRVVPSPGCWG